MGNHSSVTCKQVEKVLPRSTRTFVFEKLLPRLKYGEINGQDLNQSFEKDSFLRKLPLVSEICKLAYKDGEGILTTEENVVKYFNKEDAQLMTDYKSAVIEYLPCLSPVEDKLQTFLETHKTNTDRMPQIFHSISLIAKYRFLRQWSAEEEESLGNDFVRPMVRKVNRNNTKREQKKIKGALRLCRLNFPDTVTNATLKYIKDYRNNSDDGKNADLAENDIAIWDKAYYWKNENPIFDDEGTRNFSTAAKKFVDYHLVYYGYECLGEKAFQKFSAHTENYERYHNGKRRLLSLSGNWKGPMSKILTVAQL